MTQLVQVVYVGRKAFSVDNVARSGKCWNGKGDVHEVTPAQAKILTSYADQWALVNPDDAEIVQAPQPVIVTGEGGQKVQIDPASIKGTALERMSKPELLAHALTVHKKDLDARKSKKNLIDEIEALERDPSAV